MNQSSEIWQFSLQYHHALIWFGSLFAILVLAVRFLNTRRLAWITTLLTFSLIVLGAYVRLSDAGLGCPDWPGCYGTLTPAQAQAKIEAAVAAAPGGPVSLSKAWREMIHRYLASLVGALIVAIFIRVMLNRKNLRTSELTECYIGLPLFMIGVVVLQGLFGKWTVTLLLKPAIVTSHLIGGMILLALLVTYTLQQYQISITTSKLRAVAILALLLLFTQIALGGWVSTNYAASVCGELPLCQGYLVPPMEFSGAFHLTRELGHGTDGQILSLPALTAIHWTHRVFAGVVFIFFSALVLKLLRSAGLRMIGIAIGCTLCLQIALGLGLVHSMTHTKQMLDWQLPIAAAHNGVAAFLLVCVTVLNYRAFGKT